MTLSSQTTPRLCHLDRESILCIVDCRCRFEGPGDSEQQAERQGQIDI